VNRLFQTATEPAGTLIFWTPVRDGLTPSSSGSRPADHSPPRPFDRATARSPRNDSLRRASRPTISQTHPFVVRTAAVDPGAIVRRRSPGLLATRISAGLPPGKSDLPASHARRDRSAGSDR